jgi:HK97 family phage portal protein
MVTQSDGGKLPDLEHPISFLLGHEPNAYCTKSDFMEWYCLQWILYGNAYAKLDIQNSGRVQAIHPIQARFMQLSWQLPARDIQYHVIESPYTVAEDLQSYEVVHIKALSLDGMVGINPNELWRESLAVSIALERYSASFFGQGCRPSGVLKAQGMLSDKARMNLKESWKRAYSGTSNTGSVPVLEEGLEFESMSSNNDEFQMIESKQLQTRAMANWNKISPTKCGDLSRATWSNLEQENQSFVSSTLAPILHKLEQEFSKKLLLPSERTTHSIEFDVSGLLRGDSKTRYANALTACGGPFKTVNEVRLSEGDPPIEGGDVLRTPLNQSAATDEPAQPEEEQVPNKEETTDNGEKDAT